MFSSNKTISFRQGIYFFSGSLILFFTVSYIIFRNQQTFLDEVFLVTGYLLVSSGVFLLRKHFIKPLQQVSEVLKQRTPTLEKLSNMNSFLELANVTESVRKMALEIANATQFVQQIEHGDFLNANLNLQHTNSEDEQSYLANALLQMQDKMKQIAIQEKERTWVNEGLTKFSDLLRINHEDFENLSFEIISELVKYLGVNQGGLFLVENIDDRKFLKLTASYAYNRKKFMEKSVEIGEGMIGQAYLEKELIYVTDVPKGYTHITSGLGEATPNCILIVPLVFNDEVCGVIELASLHHISKNKILFIKKISENIASLIATLRINDRTKKMLFESQLQTEHMREQEEELRQNMEELSTTQEDMLRKEREIQRLLNETQENEQNLKIKIEEINRMEVEYKQQTNEMLGKLQSNRKVMEQVIENLPEKIFLKDENGKFILLNTALAAPMHKTVEQLIGTDDFDNFTYEDAYKYRQSELEIIKSGKPKTIQEYMVDAAGKLRCIYSVKIPFKFPESDNIGILGYQVDITEIKDMEEKIKIAEARILEKEAEMNQLLQNKQDIIDKQNNQINKLRGHNMYE